MAQQGWAGSINPRKGSSGGGGSGGGGGGNKNVTTTKVQQTAAQKKLYQAGKKYGLDFAEGGVLELPEKPLVTGFDPSQTAGQEKVLGAVGAQQQLADSGADATDFLLNRALYAESNPYLGGYIDAATKPIVRNTTENLLPAVRSGAVAAGGFGGSRQGIAEGLTNARTAEAVGDAATTISSNAYGQGLNAQLQALGLLPQTQQSQLAPGLTTSGVGDVRQAQTQKERDELIYRKMFKQMAPAYTARELVGLAGGFPSGGTSVSEPAATTNPFAAALGGASLGAALAPPGFKMVGAGVGAGAGALSTQDDWWS